MADSDRDLCGCLGSFFVLYKSMVGYNIYSPHISHQTDIHLIYCIRKKIQRTIYIHWRFFYQRTQNRKKKRAEVLFNDILKTKSIRHCGSTDISTSSSFTTKIFVNQSIYFHPKNKIQWVFSPKKPHRINDASKNPRVKPTSGRPRFKLDSKLPRHRYRLWLGWYLASHHGAFEPEIRAAMVLGSQDIDSMG